MSHYSDPQHALLARIAKALERIADTLEKTPNPSVAKVVWEVTDEIKKLK